MTLPVDPERMEIAPDDGLTLTVMAGGMFVVGTLATTWFEIWAMSFRRPVQQPVEASVKVDWNAPITIEMVTFAIEHWVETPRIDRTASKEEGHRWRYAPGVCEWRLKTDAPIEKLLKVRGFTLREGLKGL